MAGKDKMQGLLTVAFTADAFGPVRVVAYPNKTTAPIACIGEAIGARSQDGLVVVVRAAVELIELKRIQSNCIIYLDLFH